MAIQAAIFDCDGTLLDTMDMWRNTTAQLLNSYGLELTKSLFDAIEPLTIVQTCDYIHQHCHVDASGDAVMQRFNEIIRNGYERSSVPLPGVCEFLQSLRAHGVRMVVASSTPKEHLEFALKRAGIFDFFERTFSTGGSIRSKEYPDIWEAAHTYLGTDASSTWVFEDTPFGVREAKVAKLNTVCIFDAHMQRDIETCKKFSDVFIHSYAELSYELLDDFEPLPDSCDAHQQGDLSDASANDVLSVLIVAGSPAPSSLKLVQKLARANDYLIAADGGANVLYKAGVIPQVFCGDTDSVDRDAYEWVTSCVEKKITFPREKYATDLQLALDCAVHEARRRRKLLHVTLTCASGGRADHALGVVGVLARAASYCPTIVEDSYTLQIISLRGRSHIHFAQTDIKKTVSVIALTPWTCISETGFKWNLSHYDLAQFSDEGISNVVEDSGATIVCHSGKAAVFIMHG